MSERIGRCLCDTRETHPTSECVAPWETSVDVQQRDMAALLKACGLSDHARPHSPHAVLHREVLPAIADLRAVEAERDALRATVERVEALVDAWRYKGEFGWGAWQEGHGPDFEGAVYDDAAARLRAALAGDDGGLLGPDRGE